MSTRGFGGGADSRTDQKMGFLKTHPTFPKPLFKNRVQTSEEGFSFEFSFLPPRGMKGLGVEESFYGNFGTLSRGEEGFDQK